MEPANASFLASLSLDPNQIKDLAKNQKLCDHLQALFKKLNVSKLEKKNGNLLVNFVSKSQWANDEETEFLSKYIVEGKLGSNVALEEAVKWMKANKSSQKTKENIEEFEKAAGVGINYSKEEMTKMVQKFIKENKEEISANSKAPGVMVKLRALMKFAPQADAMEIYNELSKAVPKQVVQKEKEPAEAKKKEESDKEDEDHLGKEAGNKFRLEKLLARDLAESMNPPDVLAAHKARTGGAVVTRFPPEPNGYLHIGHAKAIRFSFKVANDYGGYTYLRYDDTNPEKECEEFIVKIRETIEWLGYKPKYITYASDNFQKIYDVAIELIKRGMAYVCKLDKEENKRMREACLPSPFRDNSVEVNLREFALMTAGFYDEGDAILRAKISLDHANPNMRDPAIYRIKYVTHPHVGDKWCVYPLYDFVHSLCDSFEDITHSLCTLEFENRRDLYYWSLNALNMYRPFVWEFSRLNINYNVLSKRKILLLVEKNIISGWDDPRLLTLEGLKRRGVPPQAIIEFCDRLGVTRRGNDGIVEMNVLEGVIREYMQEHSPHVFAIADPVEVELEGATEGKLEVKDFGMDLVLKSKVFVEKSDVRLEDSPDFFGIAPQKTVRLRHGPFLKILDIQKADSSFKVKAKVLNEAEVGNYKKIKGVLHWLAVDESVNCELRFYEKLFTTGFPGKDSGDILTDINKNSKKVYTNAKLEKNFAKSVKFEGRWQFERLGFFALDKDSDLEKGHLVFNRVVGMKDKEREKLKDNKGV